MVMRAVFSGIARFRWAVTTDGTGMAQAKMSLVASGCCHVWHVWSVFATLILCSRAVLVIRSLRAMYEKVTTDGTNGHELLFLQRFSAVAWLWHLWSVCACRIGRVDPAGLSAPEFSTFFVLAGVGKGSGKSDQLINDQVVIRRQCLVKYEIVFESSPVLQRSLQQCHSWSETPLSVKAQLPRSRCRIGTKPAHPSTVTCLCGPTPS